MISESLKRDIKFLNTLNVNQFSVKIDDMGGELKPTPRRSKACNFFRWCIHLITFTLVPRNKDLDKVTRRIFNSAEKEDIKKFSPTELSDAKKAFEKLQNIIKINSGSKKVKINQLLVTIDTVERIASSKLKHIGEETSIREKESIQPVNPPQKLPNTKLKELLIDLKARNAYEPEIVKEISPVLLQLTESVELTHEEINTLCRGLRNLPKEWLDQNARQMTPQMVQFVVEKSFQGEGYGFISYLFSALLEKPASKENLTAWAHGFPAFKAEFLPKGTYMEKYADDTFLKKQLNGKHDDWERTARALFESEKLTANALEEHLSQEDVKLFITNFFGFIAYASRNYHLEEDFAVSHFKKALDLIDDFSLENRQHLLETLCYARPVETLIRLLRKSKPEDRIVKRILELNPQEEDDYFFKSFAQELTKNINELADFLSKIKPHVFDGVPETNKRRQVLIHWIGFQCKVAHLKKVPLDMLKCFHLNDLLKLVEESLQNSDQHELMHILRLLVLALDGKIKTDHEINNLLEKTGVCIALLPFLNEEVQASLTSKVLKNISSEFFYEDNLKRHAAFLEVANKLPPQVWEKASEKIGNFKFTKGIQALQVNSFAAVIHGQIKNKDFLHQFFKDYFKINDFQKQKELIAQLKPEVFEFNYPTHVEDKIWKYFFEILGENPNEHEKKLLAIASLHLFKDLRPHQIDFFSVLTAAQIKLLPKEQFSPSVSLILALMADQFEQNLANNIQNMTADEEKTFVEFLKAGQKKYAFDFKKLINWLSAFNPHPPLLKTCVTQLLTSYEIALDTRMKLMKEMSADLLETYVTQISKSLYDEQLWILIDKLEPQKAKAFIEKNWEKVIGKFEAYRNNFPYVEILRLMNDAEKLKQLLQAPLDPNYVGMIVHYKNGGYLKPIFHHLEKHPWKLFLTLEDGFANKITSLKNWVTNDSPHINYPLCQTFIERYAEKRISKDQCQQFNEQLQDFFQSAQKGQFTQANEVLKHLDQELRYYLTHFARLENIEEICDELPYLNEGQLFGASCFKDLNEKIQKALDFGIKEKKLSEDIVQRVKKILQEGTHHPI